MTKRYQLLTAAAAFALFSVAGTALASDDGDIRFAREVNSCIAAINESVDYDDATRVRHTVVEVKNTFIGYVFEIDTDVFTNSDEIAVREYASYCVAKGDSKPVRFEINKISG